MSTELTGTTTSGNEVNSAGYSIFISKNNPDLYRSLILAKPPGVQHCWRHDIGALYGFVVNDKHFPPVKLPFDHFNIPLHTAACVSGIGTLPGYKFLYQPM